MVIAFILIDICKLILLPSFLLNKAVYDTGKQLFRLANNKGNKTANRNNNDNNDNQ